MLVQMRKTHAVIAVEATTGRPLEELLRELHVEKGYKPQEIADAITARGVPTSRETVRLWLIETGLDKLRPSAVEALGGEAVA